MTIVKKIYASKVKVNYLMFLCLLSSSSFILFVTSYCWTSDNGKGFEKKFLFYIYFFFLSSALFANFNIALFIDNNA